MGDTLLPPSTDQFNLSSMSYIGHACLVTEKPAAREKQLEGMNFLFEQPESELAEVVRRAEMGSKLSVATTAKRAKVPKRKPGKKDRHSKIPTAKGLRDRRMRLSLDVARKFFKLQDLLGYDKASKTVKWLMDNAQLAIKHLARSTSLPAARVPSEVESQMVTDWKGSSKQAGCDTTEDHTKAGEGKGGEERCLPPSQKTTVGTLRRAISLPAARESREKARARARERTNEKKLKRRLEETVNQEEGIRSKTICSLSELVAQLPEISCHSQENEHSASIDDMTHDSFRSLFDHNENYGLFLNDQNHDAGDGRIGWTDELIADWDSDEITLSSASFSPPRHAFTSAIDRPTVLSKTLGV